MYNITPMKVIQVWLFKFNRKFRNQN